MKELKIGHLTIKVPIVQGGMGVGISLSGLAGAVASQGGLGIISSVGLGVIYRNHSNNFFEANDYGLQQEIRKAREIAKGGVIGVNIMVAKTNFVESVKTAIAEGVDIIFSGAGLPLNLPSFLKEGSLTKLAPIVSSARSLKVICDKWLHNYNYLPDAVVVEGPKAGGHLGYKLEQIEDEENCNLEQIVTEVIAEVRNIEAKHGKTIPVIAGGGIYTGEDIYKIMQLGVDAVQMGTRFVATDECDASPVFKQTYIDAKKEDIEIIKSPVGMPGRAIHNGFLDRVQAGEMRPKTCPYDCIKTCKMETTPYCIMNCLVSAYSGRMNTGYAFAGANAWRTDKIISVEELMNTLKAEYDEYASKQ
ncbi:MAG: nitronate monooxygenase family protein [Rikenellaceae bacterium]